MNDHHHHHHKGDSNKNQAERNRIQPDHNDIERLMHSESPRAQQIRLYQSLKEEIDKNSAGRVRYVDSELYFSNLRHNKSSHQRPSEVQTATLDIGTATAQSSTRSQSRNYNNNNNNNVVNTKALSAGTSSKRGGGHDDHDIVMMEDVDLNSSGAAGHDRGSCKPLVDGNCQVCLIKEVRDGLVNVTKIVQERNEQLSKLKARHLRSFFERQMLD